MTAAAITRIEVIPIRAARKEAVRSGLNPNDPVSASEFGILVIHTGSGIEGYGEISITFPRIGHTLCFAAEHLIAPALIGRDALQLAVCLAEIDRLLAGELSAPYLRAAFEIALLDVAGKHYEIPLYQLLGGRVRDRIPLAWGIYRKPADEMARDAMDAMRQGYHAIKLKIGGHPFPESLEEDLIRVRAVVDAVGRRTPLRLDANMAYRSVAEAAQAIDAFAEVATLAWIEQPLPRHNLAGLALLRERTRVPIMADESCQSLRDAYELARTQAADVWNVYVVEAGGLTEASHIFALANTLDIPCILGSQAEMGIGTAACAHLAAALPNLPYAIETFGPLRYQRDIVFPAVPIANGYVTPPEGPGLGVTLDRDAVDAQRAG
ncbi:MAG TPA: enolase C-terminal domain-like protein [Bryobacteraceae bacterium]|nr:enolase C-terminal domain-like protein [Bryobacteraceae bacterium]